MTLSPDCMTCKGAGWICECHGIPPPPEGECPTGGALMPCDCNLPDMHGWPDASRVFDAKIIAFPNAKKPAHPVRDTRAS